MSRIEAAIMIMRTPSKLFAVAALFFCFVFAAAAQESESDETSRVTLPPAVRAQIVRRILTHYFKPGDRKKVINVVGDDLESSWLPKIKGIEFRLLTEEAAAKSGESVYVFREIEKSRGGSYDIPFGFGSSGSGYSGDTWTFRYSKKRLTLWKQQNAGWGASGADFGPDDRN